VGISHSVPQHPSNPASSILDYCRKTGLVFWVPFVIFYAVLANIPFWLACPWLGIYRNAWFCLEYVAVGLLALFVPRFVAAGLLLLIFFLDVLDGVCQTYFLVASQALTNLSALRQFSVTRLLAGVVITVMILAFTVTTLFFPLDTIKKDYRWRTAACLLVFAAFNLSVDGASVFRRTGGILNYLHPKPSALDTITASSYRALWSRVPTVRLARKEIAHAKSVQQARGIPVSAQPVRSATAEALAASGLTAGTNPQELPNLVVIVVESWGLDSEASVSKALTSAYSRPGLLDEYKVLQGSVPFYGPTVAGEARELCGNMIGFHLLDASSQELQGCLPDRLAAMGYRSVAMHGMEGHMFDRSKWYKTIGFQETWFKGQFQQAGLPSCVGVFTGTCDAAIAKWMGHRLESDKTKPYFLYWMTLDSHLPVRIPAPLKNGASCAITPSLAEQPGLCSWYQLVANVHQSVADLAMSNLGRPTVFAIVGDHAPPFNDPALRADFSDSVVPYVVLVPRSERRRNDQALNMTGK